MAMFYGSVQGARGKATRLGNSQSGLKVSAQSWSGSVIVLLYRSSQSDEECVDISVSEGSTNCVGHSLYSGPISKLFQDSNNFGR